MSWNEWVFSGIGTAAVGTALTLILRVRKKKSAKQVQRAQIGDSVAISGKVVESAIIAAPVSDSQIAVGNNVVQSTHVHHHHSAEKGEPSCTEPSPGQIIKDLASALPYDKIQLRDKYRGLKVIWEVIFNDISDVGSGCVIHLFDEPYDAQVVLNPLAVPKEIQVAAKGSKVLIRGEIDNIGMFGGIWLKRDAQILRVTRPPDEPL